jgi:hypothetical protein
MASRRAPLDEIGSRRLYVVVRPSDRAGALAAAMRCLKRLVPRARVIVAPEPPPVEAGAEVVTVDAEEIALGPLSAATALERERAATARGESAARAPGAAAPERG